MPEFKKIVILQTAGRSIIIEEELARLRLTPDDYIVLDVPYLAEQQITTDQRQLFITGSFRGDIECVAGYVQGIKDKNPLVVCLAYSAIDDIEGPFEGHINRSMYGKQKESFYWYVDRFLRGVLNRKGTRPRKKKSAAPRATQPTLL